MLVSFLICFYTFSVSTCKLLNHKKHLFCAMILNDFNILRNMIFDVVPDFVHHLFLHWFWKGLALILTPFWTIVASNSMFVGDRVFDNLLIPFLIDCWSKVRRRAAASLPFRIIFLRTCTLYWRKTYKCQKLRFPTFF